MRDWRGPACVIQVGCDSHAMLYWQAHFEGGQY